LEPVELAIKLATELTEPVHAVEAINDWAGRRDAVEILGSIDAVKLRSSLTLFEAVSGDPLFAEAIDAFFDGPDAETLRLLKQA